MSDIDDAIAADIQKVGDRLAEELTKDLPEGLKARYVTAPVIALDPVRLESVNGRGDPDQHYRLYRLCPCDVCDGTGKIATAVTLPSIGVRPRVDIARCVACRGEGRTLELVATCATPQDLGVALVTLAGEGEFSECPIGILEDGGSWLIRPWLPSPRNVSDAARTLAKSKGDK